VNVKAAVIAGVALVVLSGIIVRHFDGAALADARTQVVLAHDSLAVVQKEVVQVHAHADSIRVQGVKLRAAADSALRVATKSEKEAARLRAAVHADTLCKQGDSLAVQDSITIASLHTAVDKERRRGDSLQVGLDEALTSLARLNAAAGRLDTASHALMKASKPSFWSRITPKPGLGVTAGINPQSKFDVVAGVSLGWSF
jgi:hypothetical protein